jgi:lysophospholipase L1-like esterase
MNNHKPFILFLFITCALCVFCGPSTHKKEDPVTLRIAAFGDSTTAFRDDVTCVYSQRLASSLSSFSTPEHTVSFEIINAGVSGHTTRNALDRFDRDILERSPHLVIIQFGLNDSCIDVQMGKTGPRVSREDYEKNLLYFIEKIREQHARVILMTPNPARWTEDIKRIWGKPPYDISDPMGFNLLNSEYAESVRELGKKMKVPVVDIYRLFLDYHREKGKTMDELLTDGIHPNDRGHRLITSALLAVVKKEIAVILHR